MQGKQRIEKHAGVTEQHQISGTVELQFLRRAVDANKLKRFRKKWRVQVDKKFLGKEYQWELMHGRRVLLHVFLIATAVDGSAIPVQLLILIILNLHIGISIQIRMERANR